MPGGDGTGPDGRGGWCTPLWRSGQISRPAGFFGRGRGNRFWARSTGLPEWQGPGTINLRQEPTKQEISALENEMEFLNNEMKSIESRLKELKK